MAQLVCPTRDQLAQFNSGQLSDEQALPIGQHLDECADCRSLIETISNLDDTLFSALRRPIPDDTYQDESGLRRAESLIQAIGREPSFAASGSDSVEAAQQLQTGRIGPYQLLEKLGQGGMGTVYKALHTQLDKIVAVKVLPADKLRDAAAVNRFQQEMKAVGRLEHRHIVRATDAGETDGIHFLVMEYVDGIDLSQLAKRHGRLSISDACELARQAARGLQYAHEQHLVHRDIKPANLMLARAAGHAASASRAASAAASRAASAAGSSPQPVVKILDLGLARLREEQAGGDHEPLTATGQLMGTLEYMAPEQGTDTHSVDIRADVYSLGATLFKLLTGTAPFPATEYNGPIKLLAALATQPIPSIQSRRDDLPPELVEIVDKMLARDPADRFATPAEVAEALAPFTSGADLARLLADVDDLSATVLVPPAVAEGSTFVSAETDADSSASRAPSGAGSSPRRKRLPALSTLLAGILLAAGITLFLRTRNGVVKIDINDPAVQVTIDGGHLTITQKNSKQPITLTPGEHTLSIQQGALTFETDKFTLKKGEKLLLRVERLPGKIQVVNGDKLLGSHPLTRPGSLGAEPRQGPGPWKPTPEQQQFMDAVAKMGPNQQIEAVREKLKELNPGFNGKLEHKIAVGKVTELKLPQPGPEHLWPVAALGTLERLDTTGTAAADFPPLAGMPLKHLRIDLELYNEPVAQVVRGMKTLQTINGEPAAEFWKKFTAGRQEIERERRTAAAWSAAKRLAFVRRKLIELNPDFDGKLEHNIERGRVVELTFITDQVTDISPVRALPGLERLYCNGSAPGKGRLADLSPLQGMPLTILDCDSTRVADLSPLQGMKLTILACNITRVTDLSPLQGMKLTILGCNGTRVSDLSPLQGMPLTILNCPATRVTDLSPLKGMPLTELYCHVTRVADLSPLQGMPLTYLQCDSTRVADLSPLQGMPLTYLNCGSTRVTDLSPLQGMPLTQLACQATWIADLSPLKGMKLTNLNCSNTRVADLSPLQGMPLTNLACNSTRVVDLSPLQGMKLTYLECGRTRVADLSPLQGMPLTYLIFYDSTQVADLSPLKGMPLTTLGCNGTRVEDLSPLQGMPLTYLDCQGTRVSDLSPLQGMPLTGLHCEGTRVADLSPLQVMPLTSLWYDVRLFHRADETLLKSLPLKTIQAYPFATTDVAEFWKQVAARRKAAAEFARSTAKLPADKQIAAVRARLAELDRKLDPNSKATLAGKTTGETVTEATLALIDWPHDLTPLMAFTKLKKLTITGGPDGLDLSPLKFLPLEELTCSDAMAKKNAPVLKGIKTLKTINNKPAAAFWKAVDGKKTAKKTAPKPVGKKEIGWQRTIDDGEEGYSEVSRKGSVGWQSSRDAEVTKRAYGGDYRYNEDGAATARWTFADLPPGRYEVFVTWTALPNRARKAVYVVYDGKQGNKPSRLDQHQSPGGVRAGGFWWKSLGKYQISRGMLAVELDARISSGGGVVADAVRIVRIK